MPSATHNSTNKNPPCRLIFEVSYALCTKGPKSDPAAMREQGVLLFTKHQLPTNRRGGLCPPASYPYYTATTTEDARAISTTKAVKNSLPREGKALPYNVTHRPLL